MGTVLPKLSVSLSPSPSLSLSLCFSIMMQVNAGLSLSPSLPLSLSLSFILFFSHDKGQCGSNCFDNDGKIGRLFHNLALKFGPNPGYPGHPWVSD